MPQFKHFRRAFLALAFLLFACASFAQDPFDEIRRDHGKAGGVYYMYQFDSALKRTVPPKGYKPFYISHYGRHGARYVLSDDQYELPYSVLSKAAADSALTETGMQAWQSMQRIYPDLKFRAGDLTPKGAREHEILADRMYDSYPTIFRHHPQIIAEASTLNRCGMSMAAFCNELVRRDRRLHIDMQESKAFMPYINAYSTDNPYVRKSDLVFKSDKASWYPAYLDFCAKKIDNASFIGRLFKDTSYVRAICSPLLFENDLFYLAVSLPCTDFDDVSLMDLFPEEELFALWECDNYTYYVQKGPDPRNADRSKQLSTALLRQIIETADSDIVSGNPDVRLRFGHDGCIMGLLSLMHIDGWDTVVNAPDSIKLVWQSYRIPMASNIQFIFYRSRRKPDDILVKMLLNEQETALPFESDCAPYYHWSDFKKYYYEILNKYEER